MSIADPSTINGNLQRHNRISIWMTMGLIRVSLQLILIRVPRKSKCKESTIKNSVSVS